MRHITAVFGVSLLTVAAFPAAAQTTRDGMTPYGSYVGIGAGQSKFDRDCSGGGTCDDTDTGLKLFGGTKFRDWLGVEATYLDFGKAQLGAVDQRARGLDISALFALPLGQNSDIHAKAGATYIQSKTGGADVNGWEPSYGVGAAIGVYQNWQVRLDWDRYKFEVPGGKDKVEMLSAGLQYRF